MTIFYRGAGVGSWHYVHDAQVSGFVPKNPAIDDSKDRLIQHIARSVTDSPYISLTRSFGIAYDYAVFGRVTATEDKPGFVYEIEISARPKGFRLVDPIREIARSIPHPTHSSSYQHDGDRAYLLGVVTSTSFHSFLLPPIPP